MHRIFVYLCNKKLENIKSQNEIKVSYMNGYTGENVFLFTVVIYIN